ncbi:MAG: tRNA (guanosine(37)-N1)-methyltransferase TrmD [Firmicutes bacterium]|nr:tRNA (guanosine(37)-N1)-methyltransferase TrmD [Bacillota bacterium]
MLYIDILTLFPEMFAPLQASIVQRAQNKGIVDIRLTNIRDYATDKHHLTDDRLYGGGAGMVMKPEPLLAAAQAVRRVEKPRILVMSPAGRVYDQSLARELAQERQLILICGHYEGIDQRVIESLDCQLISLGDFVLTGGETAAIAVADSVTRLLPGALGDDRSAEDESFSDGLLEYPQYTRPPEYQGLCVPQVLQSGDHAKIAAWRRRQSLALTWRNRPDLLKKAALSPEDAAYLYELRSREEQPFRLYAALLHYPVYNKKKQIIHTSLTNLDLHDIARAACTYGLSGYFVIQPMEQQRRLIGDLLQYWQTGFGARYNPDRQRALSAVKLLPDLAAAIEEIRTAEGAPPALIATSAKAWPDSVGYEEMRGLMRQKGGSYLLLFGTGFGLTDSLMEEAGYRLRPLYGAGGYNHLSVRSAASIIFDRLLGRDL